MELSLDIFQIHIPPSRIKDAKEILPLVGPLIWPYEGTVLAQVFLADELEVLVDLKKDQILSTSCTCDDEDPLCVHVVAVLLKLQKEGE